MRLPRLTTRRLMALVALAALVAAVYAGLERRRAYYRRLAREHWALVAANSVVQVNANRTIYRASPSLRKRQIAHHHASLAIKYDNAASRPWLPVPPDPPEPK